MSIDIEKGIIRALIVLSVLWIIPAFIWVGTAWGRVSNVTITDIALSLIFAISLPILLLWFLYFAIKWIIAGFQIK